MMGLTMVTKLWADNLPEHLRYNEENLQMQLSMLETSSNSGAWCFCVMHVTHTNCALALNAVSRIYWIHHSPLTEVSLPG